MYTKHSSSKHSSSNSSVSYRSASLHIDACSERLRRKNDFEEVAPKQLLDYGSSLIICILNIVVANIIEVVVV